MTDPDAVLAAIADLRAELVARLDTMQAELTEVHGLTRQTARVTTETRNRLDILMDAYGAHRREYLAAHPHDEG
jgi:hypothetical protein